MLWSILSSDTLSPHGICLLWRPELIWLHAISDLIIGVAYFSIPVALGFFAAKRSDIEFGWMLWCFVAFILACGTTHFLSIWTLWVPDYGIEGLVKAATALASVGTAILLWPILPKVLALPSPSQLKLINAELVNHVVERDHALASLRVEQEIRAKAEAAVLRSQRLEAVGQVASGVAHDFNNLLTVIIMNLRQLQRSASAGQAAVVDKALAASDRSAKLISQLLAFARKQPMNQLKIDLVDTVSGVLPILKEVGGRELDIRVESSQVSAPVLLDPLQFENALVNLIVNAKDAGAGQVNIAVTCESDSVCVSVSDDGEGMDEETLAKAVEPFFTTKPVGAGSGLGLSQVHGFVQQSGGTLTLASTPATGTRIVIEFPRHGD